MELNSLRYLLGGLGLLLIGAVALLGGYQLLLALARFAVGLPPWKPRHGSSRQRSS